MNISRFVAEYNLDFDTCTRDELYTAFIGPAPYNLEYNQEQCADEAGGYSSAHYYIRSGPGIVYTACSKTIPCIRVGPGVTITTVRDHEYVNLSKHGKYIV